LGVKNLLEKDVSVYPNPAKDIINISGVSGLKNILVYDISGRLVYKTHPMT
jgi:hypothetical protein